MVNTSTKNFNTVTNCCSLILRHKIENIWKLPGGYDYVYNFWWNGYICMIIGQMWLKEDKSQKSQNVRATPFFINNQKFKQLPRISLIC